MSPERSEIHGFVVTSGGVPCAHELNTGVDVRRMQNTRTMTAFKQLQLFGPLSPIVGPDENYFILFYAAYFRDS